MKSVLRLAILLGACVLLSSWGRDGHQVISSNAAFAFSQNGSQFLAWSDYLADHSSDPDNRRSSDPNESPRHFIDIDNYPEFVANGKISDSYAENVAKHGEEFVIKQGTLPWATLATYDSLRSCFSRGDWNKAASFAADLGHYVADGHMPLHISANYDGQLTGNKGIHSRYESTTIRKYKAQITYDVKPVTKINDPKSYVFAYLYASFTLVDSVLAADNYATQKAGNTTSDEYTRLLWEKTQSFTVDLFKEASEAFASLLYSAWVEAGSPQMPLSGTANPRASQETLQVAYNGWLKSSATINYSVPEPTKINLSVYDTSGCLSEVLASDSIPKGEYSLKWKPDKTGSGIWFIVLRTEKDFIVRKVIL